ncbi:MAG: TetR/AcrR family transcriptional regulator [Sporolactobacillus sp.]|nr:TetR/AcrR family transcriptional regulator [Sporolactobacillus sp.]
MREHIGRSHMERRDAAENRRRILQMARRLFRQYGVEHVSMNQIAKAAGIGPGTLYRRFHNKSELCLALIRDNIVRLFNDIDTYLEQNRNRYPEQRLKQVLQLFIQFRENKSHLLAGVEGARSAKAVRALMDNPLYARLHRMFVALFNEMAEREGRTVNSIFRADMLIMSLSSDSYLFQRQIRKLSPEDILKEIYEMIVSQYRPVVKIRSESNDSHHPR